MKPAGAPAPPGGAMPQQATADAGPRDGARPAGPAKREAHVADAVRIVGWLSLAAGAIHAVAMVDHFDHWWLYGVFFLALTYGQVLWGLALLRRTVDDRALAIGAIANLAIVAVWLWSRTIGVPIGPEAGRPEPVGAMDVAATIDQLVLAAYVVAIVRPRVRGMAGFRTLVGRHRIRIAMALGSASVFASLLGNHQH